MNDIASASVILGTAPDLPIDVSTVQPAAPPPATPDRKGNAHDPLYHETPPRLNAEGCWAKRRGNAARKARGLPPSGFVSGFRPEAPATQAVEAIRSPAPIPEPTASQPPPLEHLIGAPIVDGIPCPDPGPALRPIEAYASTAAGLVDGSFGAAQLGLGDAWKLAPQERTALVGASQRVLHHYQLPILGPLLELALVLLPILGKRRNDPPTRAALAGLLGWFRTAPSAPVADPYRVQPAPASSAPAQLPAAYVEQPAAVDTAALRRQAYA